VCGSSCGDDENDSSIPMLLHSTSSTIKSDVEYRLVGLGVGKSIGAIGASVDGIGVGESVLGGKLGLGVDTICSSVSNNPSMAAPTIVSATL
jgi:hypothetical protein